MEQIKIYAIFDKEGMRYDTPFFAFSDIFARRRFAMMSQNPDSPLHHFKNQFALFTLGQFNVITGDIEKDVYKVLDGVQISKYYSTGKAQEETIKKIEKEK